MGLGTVLVLVVVVGWGWDRAVLEVEQTLSLVGMVIVKVLVQL